MSACPDVSDEYGNISAAIIKTARKTYPKISPILFVGINWGGMDLARISLSFSLPAYLYLTLCFAKRGLGEVGFGGAGSRIDENSKTLLCVARLSPEKDHLMLIEAAATVVAAGVDLRLVLVGDGPMRPIIEQRIKELRLNGRVEITGWLSEQKVRWHILAARAMVLPSCAEGLPVSIMEAMALGRPVISTHVAGIPELITHGQTGWLVPAGDTQQLVDAIREAMLTPIHTLRTMGAKARDHVRKRHCLQKEVSKLEAALLKHARTDGRSILTCPQTQTQTARSCTRRGIIPRVPATMENPDV